MRRSRCSGAGLAKAKRRNAAAGDQVSRYWGRYRMALVTNTRDFVLVAEDAVGRPAKLETFRLAAIATSVRKAEHAPAEAVEFRHLWGQAKPAELLETAESEPESLYGTVKPTLPLGLPFAWTAISDERFDWPSPPEKRAINNQVLYSECGRRRRAPERTIRGKCWSPRARRKR